MHTAKTLQSMIRQLGERHGFDVTAFAVGACVRLERGGYLPLVIRRDSAYKVSIAHVRPDEGQAVDPRVVLHTAAPEWVPLLIEQPTIVLHAGPDVRAVGGEVRVAWADKHRPSQIKKYNEARGREVAEFCRIWARNIREQGWLLKTGTTVIKPLPADVAAALAAQVADTGEGAVFVPAE